MATLATLENVKNVGDSPTGNPRACLGANSREIRDIFLLVGNRLAYAEPLFFSLCVLFMYAV